MSKLKLGGEMVEVGVELLKEQRNTLLDIIIHLDRYRATETIGSRARARHELRMLMEKGSVVEHLDGLINFIDATLDSVEGGSHE